MCALCACGAVSISDCFDVFVKCDLSYCVLGADSPKGTMKLLDTAEITFSRLSYFSVLPTAKY